MVFVLILALTLLAAGVQEYSSHAASRQHIPVRIHVNGTRGKSTTTRLIAAALRQAGWRVIAKTTGSAARLLLEDGQEQPITRRGLPNIIEQRKVIAFAARRRVDAIVVECMALHPEIQWIAEHRLLRATIAVITNVRQDHSDVMGSSLEEIARTLALTIPQQGIVVTAEREPAARDVLFGTAARKDTTLHLADPTDITEEDLKRFTYPVFRENVACALTVCTLLGIPRDIALHGMATAAPDPGVMHVYRLNVQGKNLYLVNAFAANDPVSTSLAWEFLTQDRSRQFLQALPVIGLFNHRSDRGVRTKELLTWIPYSKIPLRHIVVLGPMNFLATWYLRRQGFSRARVHHAQRVRSPRALLDRISPFCEGDGVLLGFGNIKGAGQHLLTYFEAHGERIL